MATLLEASLKLVFAVGIRAALVVSGLFLLYVVIGISAVFLGWPALSYPIFSIEADPFFASGGAAVGLFIVQSSGAFVLYHILVGIEDDKSQLAILFGFISLGFGGALLRITLSQAIQVFLTLI
ncbi:hypothetical protein [Haloplanus rubicundus]|nr:hypothetical protein [Haloplanus rubicundus]